MPDTVVSLQWSQDLNHTLDEALKKVVVDRLVDDPKVKQMVADGIKDVSAKLATITRDAVAVAMKDELGEKYTALRSLINQALVDYTTFATQNASDYAARRFKEINAALTKIG